jgi:starch synthase (maltosyl-transferring)
MSKTEGIRLYNMFPKLVGNMSQWLEQVPRIKEMGFNAIWVNPFHYAGFSGSMYSPKNYYRFADCFIDGESKLAPIEQLKAFIKACHKADIKFIMDLVINHTAIDSDLLEEHPNWFKYDKDSKVVKPGAMHDGEFVVWGDLAEVNNENSPDREALWDYWLDMIKYYLEAGVDGFRCDMAYQVPSVLWSYLIPEARKAKEGCLFIAESLGCDFKQVEELGSLGFDYLFNSTKYWDFNAPWGMEQYHKNASVAKTIAFPESHDTPRLLEELKGDVAALKRQFLFSAMFSAGYMIPLGFEFGFRKQLNVVKTEPGDWEDTSLDLSDLIKKTADLKKKYPVLNIEKGLEIVDQANWPNVFCFKRSKQGEKTIFVLMNKDKVNPQNVYIPDVEAIVGGPAIDVSPENAFTVVPRSLNYNLKPSELKIIAQE